MRLETITLQVFGGEEIRKVAVVEMALGTKVLNAPI